MQNDIAGTPPAAGRFFRDRQTWMAYLVLALFAYLETIIGPIMPFLRLRLDLDYTVASFHFSAFAVGGMVVGLVGERLIRMSGRRRALWGGITGMVGGATLLAVSPNVIGTILGAFAMGSLGILALVTNQAILADRHPAHRTVALTESNVAASAASILAPLAVGGFAVSVLGWQAGVGVAVVALGWLSWQFRRIEVPSGTSSRRHHAATQALPATFWLYWVALALLGAVEWCVAYWGADFLASAVGFRPAAAATTMSVFFAAMVAGRLAGARLARRYPGSALLLAALVIATVGFPLFWLGGNPVASVAGLFVAGFGIANFYPLTVAAATNSVPHLADQAASRLAISTSSALLIAPFGVGALADRVSLQWALGVIEPLILLAMITTVIAARTTNAAHTVTHVEPPRALANSLAEPPA